MTTTIDHFARPVGGFRPGDGSQKPVCAVCGRPVVRKGKRTWKHGEATR